MYACTVRRMSVMAALRRHAEDLRTGPNPVMA